MIHYCSLIFFSKYQASSCIGYQSWHSSMGCSAHGNWVLHAFLRYRYFCITTFSVIDFLSSPGTFLLLSLGIKLWAFISNFRKVIFQNTVLPFIRHSVNLPNLKYWLFSLKEFNHLGEPYFLFVLSLLFRMLWQHLGWSPLPNVNWNCSGIVAELSTVSDHYLRYRLKHYIPFIFHLYNQRVSVVVDELTVQFFPDYHLWPLHFHHCVFVQ